MSPGLPEKLLPIVVPLARGKAPSLFCIACTIDVSEMLCWSFGGLGPGQGHRQSPPSMLHGLHHVCQ